MLDQNDNSEIDELIRGRTQVEIPAEVQDRLRRRLAEFRAKVEHRKPDRIRSFVYSLSFPPAVRVTAMAAALLVAVAVGLVLMPRESRASRVYAAAAEQLRTSQSLEYTIVLNDVPYVGVDFSYAAPGYRRLKCSWGIEVRADNTTGKQIILMHGTRTYLAESGKQRESLANSEDVVEQLRSLPAAADEMLGERLAGGKRLIGYRLRNEHPGTSITSATFPGLEAFDIWVDAGTREVDHADIAIQEHGKPVHRMHIQDIRMGTEIDRSLFDLTPPAGYAAIAVPGAAPGTGKPAHNQNALVLSAEIRQGAALTAVVLPMTGSYLQTRATLDRVESYLKAEGVTPAGPPLGRFGSEQSWDAGYPVQPGTRVKAPFQLVSLTAALAASAVVKGPWGTDSDARWGAFLKSVVEQGYAPAGPPMEIWSGDDGRVPTQSTEMRIPVTKAK